MDPNLTISAANLTSANGTSTNETFVAPVFPAYIRPAATVLCSLVMTIGVLGNVMVLLVIYKSKDMRSSTNIFLMNLSVADLLILLVCTPTVLVEVNSKPETWVLGGEMCKAVPFIETTVSHASVLTILAISFERYYAICEPLRAGYVCTKARAFFICCCAWIVAGVLTSPILLIPKYGLEEQKDGSKVMACLMPVDTLWQRLFYYISILIFFWVPFIVLIVLYLIIAVRLMADPGVKLQGSDTFNQRARRQLVLMLGTVVLLFFLCLMPFRVFLLWYIAAPGQSVMDLGVERYFNILNFCRVMFYVNSAVNPIIYNLMSSKFRVGFLRLCSKRSRRYFLRHRSPILLFTHFEYEISPFDGTINSFCNTVANTFWSQTFFLGSIFVFFALPLVIFVILYSVIATNLMTSPGIVPIGRQDNSTAALRYRKQVVHMIFWVVVLFFICLLPFRALVVWIIVVPHEEIGEALGNEGYFPLLYLCRVMFYVNSAVNPILYNLMSSKFRTGFLKLCGLKTNCLRKHTRALLRTSTFNTSTLTALTNSSIHRSSIFESISRSKANSFSKCSVSSHQSSMKQLLSKESLPKCHFKLRPKTVIRRKSFSDYIYVKYQRNKQLKRCHSSESFFRTECKVWTGIPVKSSIKFVNRGDCSISTTLVNGGSAHGHSILKNSTKRVANVTVKKQFRNDEDVCLYSFQIIPSCTYVFNNKDLKESFV